MKQITIKELKQLCGCENSSNNDFANKIAILFSELNYSDNSEYNALKLEQSYNIYSRLKELGYYEGV